jgi:cell division protein FtsB
MRDIGSRIQHYRLTRYAMPQDRLRLRLRWGWLLFALWLVWVGVLSEHNFLRLWRLSNERSQSEVELHRLRGEVTDLEANMRDPVARRQLAERALREKDGMAGKGEIIYRMGRERPAAP